MGVSIKLCYRPSVIKGKDGTLYYQIIIKRTTHLCIRLSNLPQ